MIELCAKNRKRSQARMYRAHVRNAGGAVVTTFYRVRLRNRSAGMEVVLYFVGARWVVSFSVLRWV